MSARAQAKERDPFKVGGLAVTIALHVGVAAGVLVTHLRPASPVIMPRDFMVAKIVRLGKKRPPNLLPTIPAQPAPTAPKTAVQLTDNEQGKAAPKKEPPPESAKPGDLQRALAHAKLLAQREAQADEEGDPNGDPNGNSDTASPGDVYATAVFKVYHDQWTWPPFAKEQHLSALARVFVDAQGNVFKVMLVKSSGNGPFDDSVTEVLNKVKKLPPPPPGLALRFERSGLPALEFAP
jgi:TonB family protein